MSWGTRIRKRATKLENSSEALPVKIALRRKALEWCGENAHVLDLYAGRGELYRAVWYKASDYVGVDREWHRDDRRLYVCDNALFVRAMPLDRFRIFDFDAYGSPWLVARLVATRRQARPGERLALVLTDGSSLKARLGRVERHLAELAGVDARTSHAARLWPALVHRACWALARTLRANLADFAFRQRAAVVYAVALYEGAPA